MNKGIYTLANDVVYNQLVALLNSIQVHNGINIPVCVIAYDQNINKVRDEVATRKNVTLLEEQALFDIWENFSRDIWKTHPQALNIWQKRGINDVYRLGMNRRYCAFDTDAPFEKFIYLDADTLVLNSLEFIFDILEDNDFLVYDFQYKDLSHVYNVNSPRLLEVFTENQLNSQIFCAGFYASKKGILPQKTRDWLISQLAEGDAKILYMSAPNQSVLNYITMKSGIHIYNLAQHLPNNKSTGCSVTSLHFEFRDNVLFDRGNQLTYLHYIGVSSKLFNRLCKGENLACPYREIFLYYRYLHEPEKQPQFTTKIKLYNPPLTLKTRIFRKLKLVK